MWKAIENFNETINDIVWIKVGIWLLLFSGILFTILSRGFQFTHLGYWMKKTIGSLFDSKVKGKDTKSKDDKASISQFQALCTSLAATLGVGNIAGVAAAITAGGPGAVFWMWMAAVFGMMTSFAENVLGIYFRRKNHAGEWSGGAMYYLRDGFGGYKHMKKVGKILAAIFALCTILASFGIGNMGQVNKIVINITDAFKIKGLSDKVLYTSGDTDITLYMLILGIILMVFVAVVLLGGIQRTASVAEKIAPFMIVSYVLGSLIIIIGNAGDVPESMKAIFSMAFTKKAAWGGAAGITFKTILITGCRRGMFSNEAGLGSTVMVNASSNVVEPVKQGMWGMFEVFADTILVCTMTALTVLTSGVVDLKTGVAVTNNDATLVADAFDTVFKFGDFRLGKYFIAISIMLFALSTIPGWAHYGVKAVEYLSGKKAPTAVMVYKIIFICMIVPGAIITSSFAWSISDTFNGMMMIPNMIGVLSLSPLVVKILKNYVDRRIRGNMDIRPMLSHVPEIEEEGIRRIEETGEE